MKRKAPAMRGIGTGPDRRAIEGFRRGCPVELIHGSARSFPAGFPFPGPEPACSGPPCPRAARRSPQRCRFGYGEAGHAALPELLKGLPCQVTVPGHPSALHDGLPAGRRRPALQVTAQARVRTEAVRFSFAPDRAPWAGFAGRGFTDRRRIRRKAAGRARRCEAMPAGERLAVLAAVMAVEAGEP